MNNIFAIIIVTLSFFTLTNFASAEITCPNLPLGELAPHLGGDKSVFANEDTGKCFIASSQKIVDNAAVIQQHTERDVTIWSLNSYIVNGKSARTNTSVCKGDGCVTFKRGDYVLCNSKIGACNGSYTYSNKENQTIKITYKIAKNSGDITNIIVSGGGFGKTAQFIKNNLSAKCIDVSGAPGTVNGAPLLLWDCETSGFNADNGSATDQKWTVTSQGFIKNNLSGKCVDVSGAPGTTNGAPLLLWDCETSGFNADNGSITDQKWTVTNQGFIKNNLSAKCIDVSGAPGINTGAKLLLWDCEKSGFNADNGSITDQKWRLN